MASNEQPRRTTASSGEQADRVHHQGSIQQTREVRRSAHKSKDCPPGSQSAHHCVEDQHNDGQGASAYLQPLVQVVPVLSPSRRHTWQSAPYSRRPQTAGPALTHTFEARKRLVGASRREAEARLDADLSALEMEDLRHALANTAAESTAHQQAADELRDKLSVRHLHAQLRAWACFSPFRGLCSALAASDVPQPAHIDCVWKSDALR
jgi:hypothetical protein